LGKVIVAKAFLSEPALFAVILNFVLPSDKLALVDVVFKGFNVAKLLVQVSSVTSKAARLVTAK